MRYRTRRPGAPRLTDCLPSTKGVNTGRQLLDDQLAELESLSR